MGLIKLILAGADIKVSGFEEAVEYGSGSGSGWGSGTGSGSGWGSGTGYGYGDGYGSGSSNPRKKRVIQWT